MPVPHLMYRLLFDCPDFVKRFGSYVDIFQSPNQNFQDSFHVCLTDVEQGLTYQHHFLRKSREDRALILLRWNCREIE